MVAVCKRRWYQGVISSQDVIVKYDRHHLGCLGETDGGGLGLCGAGGITRVGRWKPEKKILSGLTAISSRLVVYLPFLNVSPL